LQPGKHLFLRGTQRTPPTLRIGSSQLLLTCTCEEAFVQISHDANFQELPTYRIAIAADGASFWALSHDGRADLTLMTLGEGRVLTGDAAFDAVVRVVGPAPLALALLDHARRRELLGSLGPHFSPVTLQCDPPVLQLSPANGSEVPAPDPTVHTHLGPTLRALVGLLPNLVIAQAGIVPALAANAAGDACGGVRRRNLEILLAHAPEAPETAAALDRARQDPDPAVRAFWARREGGDSGFAELSRLLEQAPAGSALWWEIVDDFVVRWPAAKVSPVFEAMLRRSHSTDRRQVVAAIVRSLDPEKLRCLASFLGNCAAEEAVATVNLLGEYRYPSIEAVLLEGLGHENLTVRQAVVSALGAVGTRRSLPLLFDLTSDRYLCREAELALEKVQAREQLGDAGQVSLAAPQVEAGAVSVAEPPGGLAVVKDGKDEG
jgi:hypothetical protein